MMKLRLLSFIMTTFVVLFMAPRSQAKKIQAKGGIFNVSAKTDNDEGSLSNIGSYQLTYHQPMFQRVDLFFGYTVIMSNGVGGDMGFGFDLGLLYYPFTYNSGSAFFAQGGSVEIREIWRPYVGVGFLERRFQSVKANYSGFSAIAGTERELDFYEASAIGELRYGQLLGSTGATATELLVLIGLSVPF
jgi:hypothetical protein